MKNIQAREDLVAYCGLYCGACKKYLQEKCPGCHENEKASWCKVRKCCMESNFSSCAECNTFSDIMDCKGYNNLMSKLFGLIFNSDRKACILRIKEVGTKVFADEMASQGIVTYKRK